MRTTQFDSISQVWRDIDLFGSNRAAEAKAAASRRASLHKARESIDPNEARWLVERIDEDHVIDENERALLIFIREESGNIDPMLEPLLARIA